MASTKLSDIEIQRELGTLPGWARRGDALVKTFAFGTFQEGVDFVTRVAKMAEEMQHHPDLDIRYTKVIATLSTHDSGGISATDIRLARAMDTLPA